MIRTVLPLALSLIALAAPAHAADLGTLSCVEGKLDATTREQIAGDVERNLGIIERRSSYSAPVVEALRKAGADCTTEHGWTPAAARPAILYTLARLSLPVVQRVVAERGFDPAELEALFLALPEERRNKPLTTDDYRGLADAAVPEGDKRTRENGALVRTFFEFESILQYASLDFAAA